MALVCDSDTDAGTRSAEEDSFSDSAKSASGCPSSFDECEQVDTSQSTSSDPDCYDASDDCSAREMVAMLSQRLKQQRRTAKARAAVMANRSQLRQERKGLVVPPEHPAQKFADYVKGTQLDKPGECSGKSRRSRLRLIVSYLKAWALRVVLFFKKVEESPDLAIHHTIVTTIIDDTNMRLCAANNEVQEWKTSRVVSVMNNIQTLILNYGPPQPDAPRCHKVLPVHTPLVALSKADRDSLYTEFRSRLFFFLGEVSARFQVFKIAADVAKKVPIQALTLCCDSLVTNIAVLKQLRCAAHKKHAMAKEGSQSCGPVFPIWVVLCVIHQLALSRKPIILGFPGYWSTLVRLSHLFEVQNFRTQFRRSLLAVVCDSFEYIAVPSLPTDCAKWRDHRREICGIVADTTARHNKKRSELHVTLARWDNGNPADSKIIHWCDGFCCKGGDHTTKARFAMLQCCRYLALLFSFGYPVPLLYRWVHCPRALQFVYEAHLNFRLLLPCTCCHFSIVLVVSFTVTVCCLLLCSDSDF